MSVGGDPSGFDYRDLPVGYYDEVMRTGSPVRRLWHLSKFERVVDSLPDRPGQSILDIGCFAGTFLGLLPATHFSRQLGVDILPEQITYATTVWGTAGREFRLIPTLHELVSLGERFDCITAIEVIEHLQEEEIRVLLDSAMDLLVPGGKLVLTTPNYASSWPLIEFVLNRVSDVSYQDQHVTKFTYRNFERKLQRIYPALPDHFPTIDFKTTTHLASPFLAALSFDVAHRLSRVIPPRKWVHPFGNLVLMMLTRGAVSRGCSRRS